MRGTDWRSDVDAKVANDLSHKICEMVRPHSPVDVLCALEIALATANICSSKTHREALATMSDMSEMIVELLDAYPQVPGCHWEAEH